MHVPTKQFSEVVGIVFITGPPLSPGCAYIEVLTTSVWVIEPTVNVVVFVITFPEVCPVVIPYFFYWVPSGIELDGSHDQILLPSLNW